MSLRVLRVLRGLTSYVLPCGCSVGVYETYASRIVEIVDAHADACTDPGHRPGRHVLPGHAGCGEDRATTSKPQGVSGAD